ncbi:MAG: NUDIX domain-containing protein [archaeon]
MTKHNKPAKDKIIMPLPKNPKKRKYMFTDDIKFLQKAIVLHPKKDQFLALKRPKDAPSRPDCWDLPGGNVLFGTLHLDSLTEEIREETSLEVEDIKPIYVSTKYDHEKKTEHTGFMCVTKEEFLNLKSADFLIDLVNRLGPGY